MLFISKTIQTDEAIFEKQYEDFIVSYFNNHPDDTDRELNAEMAWRKSRLFVRGNEQFLTSIVINYFVQLVIGQAAFLALIYFGCTLASPVTASACIISSGIMWCVSMSGMGGIALWYGMIIELISACIALFFILRFLKRKSQE